MELIKISQCKNSLNFQFKTDDSSKLTATNASFMPVSFEKELLNDFSKSEIRTSNELSDLTVLNYTIDDFKSAKNFLDLFKKLHSELSFVEIVRFYHKWINLKESIVQQFNVRPIEHNSENIQANNLAALKLASNISATETAPADNLLSAFEPQIFFAAFNIRFSENLQLTMAKLLETPESFQAWCAHKKWGAQDFAPLRAVQNIQSLAPYLEHLSTSLLSKTESTQTFETLVDLFLQDDKNLNSILQLPLNQWMSQLKIWRYPVQSQQIQNEDAEIKKLSWPLNSQVKWVQKGDRSGIELKLFFSHPQELDRALLKLQQVVETFETNPEAQKIWNLE